MGPLGGMRDGTHCGSRGAEHEKAGFAPAASLNDMRRSKKAEVLEKA